MISLSNTFSVATAAFAKATRSNVTIDELDTTLVSLDTSCSILGSITPVWTSVVNASISENMKSIALDSSNSIYVSGEYNGSVDTYFVNSSNTTSYKLPIGTSTTGAHLLKYDSILQQTNFGTPTNKSRVTQ
jgi:hypothetical protein